MNKSTETKVIIIYNYNHIICAMKAASKLEKKIIIESPPNAASYMGPLFFKKLMRQHNYFKKAIERFGNGNFA